MKGAFVMGKNLKFSELLDCYGELLTDKQRDAIDLYYNEDLSLAEIAQDLSISRQGVRDSIKRGEEALTTFENEIGLLKKQKAYDSFLKEILLLAMSLRAELSAADSPAHIQEKADGLIKEIESNINILD